MSECEMTDSQAKKLEDLARLDELDRIKDALATMTIDELREYIAKRKTELRRDADNTI